MASLTNIGAVVGVVLALANVAVPNVAHALSSSCEGEDGSCMLSNDGDGSVSCECIDGTLAVGPGGDWADLSQDQLDGVCKEQLAELCGPGPGGGVQCYGGNGFCDLVADPPSYSCFCNEPGTGGGSIGDKSWPGLTDDELMMVCEELLAENCVDAPGTSEGGGNEGGTTDSPGETSGNTAGTTDNTTGADSGGEPASSSGGEGASDGAGTNGSEGGSSGGATGVGDGETTDSVSTGATAEGGDETEGAGADGQSGGCSCRVDDRHIDGALGLAILGLAARRRRSHGSGRHVA